MKWIGVKSHCLRKYLISLYTYGSRAWGVIAGISSRVSYVIYLFIPQGLEELLLIRIDLFEDIKNKL